MQGAVCDDRDVPFPGNYTELQAVKAELKVKGDKRHASLKGRVAALKQEAAAHILEAARNMEKHSHSVSACLWRRETSEIIHVVFRDVMDCLTSL